MRSDAKITRISVDKVGVRRHASSTVVVVGNPNSGKSTLFNRLTGLRQRTANYPGVTVEKHVGTLRFDDLALELVDLPGMYALSTHSLEERIAVDVLLGRMPDLRPPAGILAVLDTTNLYQGLYLLQQLLTLHLPVVVALTMSDAAQAAGLRIDVEALRKRLGGVPVCPVVATTGQGIVAFVILRSTGAEDRAKGADAIKALREHVSREIGPIAKPRQIMVVDELPKTRSGKIMRRLLRDVAENREVGDVTTLADSQVMSQISAGLHPANPTTD